MILGGALGNLVDRIFYGVIYGTGSLLQGNVVDFFQINIPDIKIFGKVFYSWPIFNIADLSVTVGFVMILIGYNKIFNKKVAEEQPHPDALITNPDSPSTNSSAESDFSNRQKEIQTEYTEKL